ncbi:MAG TPA: MFS transporter [Polyangiaceae bacterium]|jgi:MFS family permease
MQHAAPLVHPRLPRELALAGATATLGVLYVLSTIPTPLYPIYEQRFHFSELVVTEIYGSYVCGNLAVLFVLGRVSDQIGRRPATLIAFGFAVAAALFFLGARSAGWLFAARALSGFSAGLGAGTLTAWIAELEPHFDRVRAATVASAGNLGGLAAGSLAGGLLARAAPWPLRTSYVVCLGLIGLAMAVVSATPETVEHPVRRWRDLSLYPRIGVPKGLRLRFVAPASMAFATFALGGFFGALVPGLVTQRMHVSSVAVVGGVVGVFFGSAAVTAGFVPRTHARTALRCATGLLFVGLVLLIVADAVRSVPVLLAATLAGGGAVAFGYRGSLQAVNEMAPPDRRAEMVSAYLLVCYTANAFPVVGVGLLGRAAGPQAAHVVFAALLAVFGLVALVVGSTERDGALVTRP